MQIVFVEDDIRLAELIQDYLVKNGFKIILKHDGYEGEKAILEHNPDIVILDLMLPGQNGMEICRRVRHKYNGPILFLTAQDDNMDEVAALEMGADDYIIKPVEPRVLLAKLRAVARRLESFVEAETEQFQFGNLIINNSSRNITLKNKKITLSPNEYELLIILVKNAGQIMSRNDLFEMLRGISYDGLDRTIDITISRLRKKLGDCTSNPEKIKTVWGKGYLFVKEAWID